MRLARLYYAETDVPTLSSGYRHVLLELPDHLGSASFVIDKDTSELVEATRYEAYGSVESDYRPERWKSYRADYRFTGKEEDIEVGLAYFGARYYSPALNRWISADPLGVHQPGEADLNLYAYVHGRVYSAIDPFGLDDGAPNNLNRVLGVIQALGGIIEAGGAISAAAGACSTGVGCPVGLVVAGLALVHGTDALQAGAQQVVTGKAVQTFTEQGLTKGANAVLKDAQAAKIIGVAGNIGIGIGLSAAGGAVRAGGAGLAGKDALTAGSAAKVASGAGEVAGSSSTASKAVAAAAAASVDDSIEAARAAQGVKAAAQASGAGGLPTLEEAARVGGGAAGQAAGPPSRLVMGAGNNSRFAETVRAGDVTLDRNPLVAPDILADYTKPLVRFQAHPTVRFFSSGFQLSA